MSKEATIWIVIAIYAIFMVVIGVVNSKNSGGMASFTVGGRNAGRYVYRVFRRLRLELRIICHTGGNWKCGVRFPLGVDGVGGAHPRGHAASQNQIHAPAL